MAQLKNWHNKCYSVHHQGLRIVTGVVRTTPNSQYIIGGEPSLELRRYRLILSCYYEIKSNETYSQHYKSIYPTFGSFSSAWLSYTPTLGFWIGEILKCFKIAAFSVILNVEDFPSWYRTQLFIQILRVAFLLCITLVIIDILCLRNELRSSSTQQFWY